jgi:photosystem II stability/assembly factor-like uncharacterized protein
MSGNGKYGIAGDLATSGTGGRLYRTINYGVSWSIVTTQPTRKWSISAMSYSGQNSVTGLYNDSNYGILYSLDYGSTWAVSDAPILDWNTITMSYSGQYVIAGNQNSSLTTNGTKIYYSTNYGENWIAADNSFTSAVNGQTLSISGNGRYALYCTIGNATSGNVRLHRSINTSTVSPTKDLVNVLEKKHTHKQTWNYMSSQPVGNAPWNTISTSNEPSFVIAAEGKNIYYSWNSGSSWSKSTTPTISNGNISSCSFSINAINAIMSVYGDYIYYSTNSGDNWTKSNSTLANWSSVAISCGGFSDSSIIAIASVYGGYIYRSTDGGTNWAQNNSLLANWTSVSISSTGQYGLACIYNTNGGGIYYNINLLTSTTWTASNAPTTLPWNCVCQSESGQYAFAVAKSSNNRIYRSTNYGLTWTQSNSAITSWYNVAISSSGQYGLATLEASGGLYFSNDYGYNWSECTIPSWFLSGGGGSSYNVSSNSQLLWRGVAFSKNGQYAYAGLNKFSIYSTGFLFQSLL